MADVRMIKNDDGTEYKCVSCGSPNVSILRPDPKNPRCKCGSCGFVFSGNDSLAAEKAGAIPSSSAETLAAADEPERVTQYGDEHTRDVSKTSVPIMDQGGPRATTTSIPRTPAFVFISKDRRNPKAEFCNAKDVKQVALKWHNTKYDVYELTAKKFEVNVDIS